MTALSTLDPSVIEAVTRMAVERGDFRPLLTRTQLQALDCFDRSTATTFSLDCSRRFGKTVFACVKTYIQANTVPGSIIRYVAPTKLHGRQFVQPTFAWLDQQVPERFRPRFDRQDGTWHWRNGSLCHLGSAETMGDVEAQVGTACHLAIIDEAGKVRGDLLRHLHRSVLRAQFLTTRGRCIVPSTPAISPAHYLAEIVAQARSEGAHARFTIDDCDHIPAKEREDMIRDLGGRESTEVKRELYCEHVPERSMLIVPEWSDVKDECVVESPIAPFRDWYVAADFGFEDLTVVLWGWYDFPKAQLVIEHELAMHQASGLDVGHAAKAIERSLGIEKALRVADAPPQLLADLASTKHGPGVAFGPAIKDDADAALNQLRMLIQQKRIRVNPRCRTLIAHLDLGVWANDKRTSFARAEGYGHWDAIDALKYMSRVVNWRRNPVPVGLGTNDVDHQRHAPPVRNASASFRAALERSR